MRPKLGDGIKPAGVDRARVREGGRACVREVGRGSFTLAAAFFLSYSTARTSLFTWQLAVHMHFQRQGDPSLQSG